MAKGISDLVALVGEVKTLADDKPTTVIGWVERVQAGLKWLTANGWTLEDLSSLLTTAVSLWALIEPLLKKPAVTDPQ